jgi:general secretion pathway protein G
MSIKLLKKQGGFTLLELLIVIVIIGILAVLIIPNLASGPARARDAQRKSDLRNIKTALETYYNDNNSYPTAGGASCVPSASSCLGTVLSTGTTPYMKVVPNDPKAPTQNYAYIPTPASCAAGACTSYTLTATLENAHDSQAGANGLYTVNSAN